MPVLGRDGYNGIVRGRFGGYCSLMAGSFRERKGEWMWNGNWWLVGGMVMLE